MPLQDLQLATSLGYRNYPQFAIDVKQIPYYQSALRPSTAPESLVGAVQGGHISNAWEMLVNTMQAPLETVLLGRVNVRPPALKPERLLDEYVGLTLKDATEAYSVLDTPMQRNFGVLTEFQKGSISWSNNWTILMNDSLILGGIQKNLPFYLVSKRTRSNIWDQRTGRFTVTGRELVGVMTAGYHLQQLADGSEVFVNSSPSPRGITLPEYMSAIDYFSKGSFWTILTKPGLFSIGFDFSIPRVTDTIFLYE